MSILSEKLQSVFKKLRGYGKLSESNIADALREVRMALLSADVNFQIARQFCDRVKEKALGQEVQASIRPGDLFVKIVHDELIGLFQEGDAELSKDRPLGIVLCGLNGAGKTTTAAKLALYLRQKRKEKVLLVACDLARPAAVKQLETLGKQIEVPVHSPAQGASLTDHIQSAQACAKEDGMRVVIYDTAGRLEVDEALLAELNNVVNAVQPQECLLVVDSATGQSAVAVAQAFQKSAPLAGLILSKFDGDAKGGSAFSVQSVTGAPVKFLGTGEQANALEPFDPQRLVNRMLGMGDVVGLVEKAQEAIDLESAERMAHKLKSNSLDLQDFLDQLRMMKKMGPLQNLLGNLPGMGSIADSALDERLLKQTEAIILSMTKQERRRPEVLNGRRRQRIALGSGTSVTQVNDLMKRFNASKKMMSKLTRGGGASGKGGVSNMERKLKGLLNKLR